MKYSLTVFDSIFDNKTHKRLDFESWQDFEKLLYRLAKMPGYKAKKGEMKKSSSLISPAIYQPNSTRANANVIAWAGWAALDVDSYEGDMQEGLAQYKDYHFVCYSTASSTAEKPKFRLVFPLARNVPAESIRHFWYALNKQFNSIGDEQAKDLSRMYYVPAQYPGANNFIFTNTGKRIDPDLLTAKHAYLQKSHSSVFDGIPQSMRDALMEARKERMTNRDIRWTSYRDCPFVSKKLVGEYRSISGIDGSGRYRMIYKIMTSIACNAVKRKYPISPEEISSMVRQLDEETSRIYQRRPLHVEAERAIEYAYAHADQ